MKTIEKEQLIEYLKHGITIVNELYGIEHIFNNYKATCEKNKPILIEKPLPDKPVAQSSKDTKNTGTTNFIIGAFLLVICIFALGPAKEADIFAGFTTFLIWLCIICAAVMIIVGIYEWSKAKEISTSNISEKKRYEDQRERIIAENKQLQSKYRVEYDKWSASSAKGFKLIESKINEIEKVIEEYFSVDIIFPKYQSLVALTSFYEYLSSGRCEELTGTNGCYNLFESEIRQNIIITKLDTIITNLEQIRQNQYILYEELKKTTSVLDQISSDLSIIRDLTFDLTEIASINMYYNSITAQNTSALLFLDTIR